MDQPQASPASANNPVTCVQCQAVTTNDGRTVWVCESCQTVNTPSLDSLVSAPEPASPPTPPSAPVSEAPATLDAASAQAELNSAAAQAETTPIPENPAPSSPKPVPSV